MKEKIKTFLERINFANRLRRRLVKLEDDTQKSLKCLGRENQIIKNRIKISQKQAIHTVFVCHSPSLWGALESVYQTILADSDFIVSIIAVPYMHSTFSDNEFHEGGMIEFLEKKKIVFIPGYNVKNKSWLDLQKLSPDYIFFQTPYDSQFPFFYTSAYVSLFARVCYVPYYGTLLYEGDVDKTTHPIDFFKNVSYYFVAHSEEQEDVAKKFSQIFPIINIINSGSPKTDYILNKPSTTRSTWKLGLEKQLIRILWTPRWQTSEGFCHFFDYKDYLLNFIETHIEIDFLFRPHPLCMQNFLNTGELSQAKYDEMLLLFDNMRNAKIDFSNDYQDTILTTDILISDMSSILYEFFMTGKPIIYTHRINGFNKFASKLAKGFYWVHNKTELEHTLQMLLSGEDPLKPLRQKLLKELLVNSPSGASTLIKETIKNDFLLSIHNE